MMLSFEDRSLLRQIAQDSVTHGFAHRRALPVSAESLKGNLAIEGASFITLKKEGKLKGCIGSIKAENLLAVDVALNAYAAAFNDPRFDAVKQDEWSEIELEVSVLSKPEKLEFTSETELLGLLQPGIDGLIIEDRSNRATFLPAVWKSVAEPKEFVRQLKIKAGLKGDYWSSTLQVFRYKTISF